MRNAKCEMRNGRRGLGRAVLALLALTALSPVSSIMLVFISLFAMNAGAQHLPAELTFPRAVNAEEDGGDGGNNTDGDPSTGAADGFGLQYSIDQTLFDKSLTSINEFMYRANTGGAELEQGVSYELRRDKLQNTRHYANVSGALRMHSLARRLWVTPGLDWTPVVQYSSDRAGNNALATIDIGPTADFDIAGIDVNLRAGLSGRRVDSLAGAFTVGEYRSSAGAYGAFSVGSEEDLLPFAPVYFFADGMGRRIENSSMVSLTSSALGALRLGERDSVFVYGDVSFFNGREGYLEGSADSRAALFTETPWRVERNVNATIGYKGDQRFIFYPSAYYSAGENTLEFLNDSRRRDEKTIRQIMSGAAATDSAAGIFYSGTLSFEWRDHDKLFGKEMAAVSTPGNIDSLEINLWDYAAFEPRTVHRVAFRLPKSFTARYEFGLSRVLTEYPNFYVSGRDTVTNKDDSDRRTQQQRLALEYKNDSTLRAEVFGEFVDYDLVFLKQAKSSSNRTDKSQKFGFATEWSPINELLITEAVSAEAKRGAFHFPAFHQKALQRPRYSRAVNSSLSTVWQITPLIGVNLGWNIKFSDYGFWYGREYMEEALAGDSGARVDFYAITSKSVYNTIDMSARLNSGETVLQAGGAISIARDRNYEGGNYILSIGDGHSIKPYVNAAFRLGAWATATAHLSRTFVTGNSALGFWDFKLRAEGGF